MEQGKILCPICDEELGFTLEEIPEKCPICDTRRYEILQELGAAGKESGAQAVVPAPDAESREYVQGQVVVEDVTIRHEAADDAAAGASAYEEGVVFSDQSEDVVFNEGAGDNPQELPSDVALDEDVVFDEGEVQPPTGLPGPRYQKSGASNLEHFPVGFKYCPSCGEGYSLESEQGNCRYCDGHPPLKLEEKGFAPGHYLVLYSDRKNAISYFRLDHAGSVIIGRSSERQSPNDIDVTLAWKNYYQRFCENPDEFKEKMRLLRGISRKHVLVRYVPAEKRYVMFHLSDNNFTVVQLPTGEKRTKPPRNRTRVDLVPGALVSMGNQQDFIVFRYKVVPAPSPSES